MPGSLQPPAAPTNPVNPVNQLLAVPPANPAPSNLPSGQPDPCLFTNTDIPSVAYKTPCNFYREGTILPVNTNIPGTHWGHRGYQLKINQFT